MIKQIFYDWGGANTGLFYGINGLRGEFIDGVMVAGSALGDHGAFPLYMALVALFGLFNLAAKRRDGLLAFREQVLGWMLVLAVFSAAHVVDGLLVGWIKQALDFPRPPLALPPGTVNVVGTAEFHHSFPSGHASFAMVTAASLWPLLGGGGRWGLALYVLWVGLSRVNLGFHFPADVAAGFLFSLAVVWILRRLLLAILARVEARP